MSTSSIAAHEPLTSGSRLPLAPFGDERLARLVASGSERAFTAIYERYRQPLYRYCRSIVRHDADAQDALQSTLASAFVALQRGQRDAPLRPWLFRIAHNEAISLIRRRRKQDEIGDCPGQSACSAEESAEVRERLALLIADLHQLPDRQRGALVMRELNGLSHEEIALALQTSVGAAKQAIFEARHTLMEFAEGRSMVCEEVRRTISDRDGRALRGRRVRAHIRDCAGCAAFAAAIPARRDDMRSLTPLLAPPASAAVLARVLGAGSGPSAGGGAGAGVVAGGATGKTVGATLAAKALTGVAVIATAVGSVAGVRALITHQHPGTRHPGSARETSTGVGLHGVTQAGQAATDAPAFARTQSANSTGHSAHGVRPANVGRDSVVPAGQASNPGHGTQYGGALERANGANSASYLRGSPARGALPGNSGDSQKSQTAAATAWPDAAASSSTHAPSGATVSGYAHLLRQAHQG